MAEMEAGDGISITSSNMCWFFVNARMSKISL